MGSRAAHAGGGPSHHAQPKVRARGACEGCRTENTHLHASCFKRRALLRSLQGVGGYLNGYTDGDSDDSAECNGSGADDRSGVEDHHAWRRAGNGNGKSASAPWCFASCGVCRGEAMYVPAASASKTKSMAWSDGLHCKTSNPLSATVKFAGRKRAKRRYPRVQTVRVPRAPLPSSQSVYFMCNEQNK